MTIIVGLKYEDEYILACDSRITEGSTIVSEQYNKIFKCDNFHVACAGEIGGFNRFIEALKDTDTGISKFKAKGKEDSDDAGMDAIVIYIDDYGYCRDVQVHSVTVTGTETYSALHEGYSGDIAVIGSGATVFLSTWRYLSKRGQPGSYEATIKRLKECFTNTARLDNCCNNKIQIITYTLEE